MTQAPTYPAHIIAAAKALAEKHAYPLKVEMKTWFTNALCEALTTTPPSEEAMLERDNSSDLSHIRGDLKQAKPEPTEDHLRRACEELGLDPELYLKGGYGMWEGRAVRTVARLLAERDAMQARVEPAAWLYERKPGEWPHASPTVQLARWDEADAARPFWTETPLYTAKIEPAPCTMGVGCDEAGVCYAEAHGAPEKCPRTEPTPDPDLVLAREAAERVCAERGFGKGNPGLLSAVEQEVHRALKLAKEQGK
jgi:hypothetical protein